MEESTLTVPELPLEAGGVLKNAAVHYRVWGDLQRDPIVWVFHALTANDNPFDWWPGLFGPGKLYEEFAVVCVNALGSPYGSTSPINYVEGGMDFPLVTVRDTVQAELHVAAHLGVKHIHTIIGASLGGYQAQEFAYSFTGKVDHLVLIATQALEKPWNKAIHQAQRLALEADPTLWTGGGAAGLKAARAVGMLTYRTAFQFNENQQDEEGELREYRSATYQNYHGQKLVDRFDAACYYKLMDQIDTHNIGRGRGGILPALSSIDLPALVVGISTDLLTPPASQQEIAAGLPNATYKEMESSFGHDGFLIEFEQLTKLITQFYHDQSHSTHESTL